MIRRPKTTASKRKEPGTQVLGSIVFLLILSCLLFTWPFRWRVWTSLLLSYGLPDPERVTKDGVGPQGYCAGIFPEPQGISNEKGKAEVKSSGSEFTSYNSQCPEPPHSGS